MTTPDICFVGKVRVRFNHLPVAHYVYYPHSNSWGCLHKKVKTLAPLWHSTILMGAMGIWRHSSLTNMSHLTFKISLGFGHLQSH
jgi:hypothetical protein